MAPTILAISRLPLGNKEITSFKTMSDVDRAVFLFGWNPAVQGVHPGESVYIYALDISIMTNFKVYAIGPNTPQELTPIAQKSIFSDTLHNYEQVEVRVPTFDKLQDWISASSGSNPWAVASSNPVMMWLQFKIKNGSGQVSPNSIPFLIWKPWPVIVAISRSPLWDENKPGDKQNQINSFKAKNNLERVAFLAGRNPAALGVYPGDSIFIYVFDLNAGSQGGQYQVSPVLSNLTDSLTVVRQDTILSDGPYFYEELEVKVSTLDLLQKSTDYAADTLLMGLQFQIKNPSGVKSWNSLPVLIWMPWPQVKEWDWDDQTRLVRVGTPSDAGPVTGTGTGAEITRFLGRPSDASGDPRFGQVRWYEIGGIPALPAAPDLLNLEKTFAPDGKPVVVLPKGLQDILRTLRNEIGTWIKPEKWTDSYVEFTAPSTPGVAILWRDDLPSRPVMNLQELANQLWRAHVNLQPTTDADVSYPVPLGGVIRLGVDRLLDAANSVLADLLEKNEIKVSFGWEALPYKNNGFEWSDLIVDSGPKESLSGGGGSSRGYVPDFEPVVSNGAELELRVPPRVLLEDPAKASLEACGAFCVQLKVYIEGELFGRSINPPKILNVGVPLIFRPTPMALPTMAIFFEHANFQGAPLIMFPKGMFSRLGLKDLKFLKALKELDDIHFDDHSDPSPLTDIKSQAQKLLNTVQFGLWAFNAFPGNEIPYADAITGVLTQISAATKLVFDSTGEIANLWNSSFDNQGNPVDLSDKTFAESITSVILVGVPYKWSQVAVNCYQYINKNKDKNGNIIKDSRILQLVLPDDTYVAAVADLRFLKNPSTIFGFSVEPPYGSGKDHQPGEPDFDNFDDSICSIEIVTPWP